jgi:hypothetical protein
MNLRWVDAVNFDFNAQPQRLAHDVAGWKTPRPVLTGFHLVLCDRHRVSNHTLCCQSRIVEVGIRASRALSRNLDDSHKGTSVRRRQPISKLRNSHQSRWTTVALPVQPYSATSDGRLAVVGLHEERGGSVRVLILPFRPMPARGRRRFGCGRSKRSRCRAATAVSLTMFNSCSMRRRRREQQSEDQQDRRGSS